MGATALITYAILMLDRSGFRPLELVIGGIVALIGLCYLAELLIVPPNWLSAVSGTVPAAASRSCGAADCGRHRGRHGDAARHLSALGA